tara:strand:+ start:652 stop:2190 length:1539 start_codon:yes stop_codon:yes gene_type:complete
MTLANLINDLKQAVQDGRVDRRNASELVEGRVILPSDFNAEGAEVVFDSRDEHPTLYQIGISASPKRSLDDVQSVLDGFFVRAKSLKFRKGVAKVRYDLSWTPEAFQDERKLTGLFFDEVEVESIAYTCDPTKVRIDAEESHEIKATTEATKMNLKATGDYREQLVGLVERLNPQLTKLNLSEEDAGRLLRAVKNNPAGKYFAGGLERGLRPEERYEISVSLDGRAGLRSQKVIELTVPTKVLRLCEEGIGKSLIVVSPNQDSQVTEFIKYYGLGELWRGERLSDLQALARDIPQMDLGRVYNHPILTNPSAKKLLDTEIDIISKGYESAFGLGPNSHMWRGEIVKRLAIEHFGAEIIEGFDKCTVDQYVTTIRSFSYEPSKSFEDEPNYIAKERHLLECFRQSYEKDPKESVQKFRESYQNSEPEMRIFASRIKKDASGLRRLRLPSQARLYSFGIDEYMNRGSPYWNELAIVRIFLSDDDINLRCRIRVDSPILLPLQEYACKEMGINFR